MRKNKTSAAFYGVVEAEAKVVRMVFEIYTQQQLSINAIDGPACTNRPIRQDYLERQ